MSWDIESLKDYFDKLREADKSAIDAALASAEKAVHVAEINSQRWRDNANEWRGALGDRERNFLTRKEFYAIIGTAIGMTSLILGFIALK